ncbi:MAG: ATP-dependent DNA helicase RecG [Nitrospirota bacterium]|nr:ATP-dependent DNA helicase RecG [Nitrospirota bacterium]
MDSDLSDRHIQYAKGVGPRMAVLMGRLGIKTIKDALYYLPYRYEDRSSPVKIRDISAGSYETVRGTIVSSELTSARGGKVRIFEAVINDGTASLKCRWFNQAFLKKRLGKGLEAVFSGTVAINAYSGDCLVIDNPEYEIITGDDDCIHTQRVVPVYRVTEGLSQRQFRNIIFSIVNTYAEDVIDTIPREIIEKNNLPALHQSIIRLHFPEDNLHIDLFNGCSTLYHKRLYFDELFMFEAGMALRKKRTARNKGISFRSAGKMRKALLENLRFELTRAQERAVESIIRDMRSPYPMHRLIQGDVGCGKTIVALLAMLNAVECGYQAVLMAPTEVLAEQHYLGVYGLIENIGLEPVLFTGGSRERRMDRIASGEVKIIIGTHALIQEGVIFGNLGLAVIDEQHKFGVMQRSLLGRKGMNPDLLVMTATPIPRSLSLTLYGDLDCSVIDELPPGRKPVVTKLFNSSQKDAIYSLLLGETKRGRQSYVVYPAIEESEKAGLKSAVQGMEAFRKIFPEFRIELLHGRMNAGEKEDVMASFKRGEIDILVSTTVIEVGMDVPNATVMLVIHAERFGLAQLHQLRGRVGRGADRSYCLLIVYEPYGEDAKRRLNIMIKSNDGFRISEEDLKIRGPGEFLGTKQAGMPELKNADIVRDIEILETARTEAFNLIDASPGLEQYPLLGKSVEAFWKGKVDFYRTG